MTDPRTNQGQHPHLAGRVCDAELPVTAATWRRSGDVSSSVTSGLPGAGWNNPLAVTTAAEIQAQESPYLFTCLFPGNSSAVVAVYGAADEDYARSRAEQMWYPRSYEVEAGDRAGGHARPFTLLLAKRNTPSLRLAVGQEEQGHEQDLASTEEGPA